ncbi:MAG: DUF4912 domain-containing protein, partial [Isosphaeraceae bacterium]|nr:DUF4912 domain-containing protein [Isosphaeraceae bacterium]
RAAEALRRRLENRGLIAQPVDLALDESPEGWSARVTSAAVVGVPGPDLAADPMAWVAWAAGIPVVRYLSGAEPGLADAIREALDFCGRPHRGVAVGAALAARRASPEGVAQGWMEVYLDTLSLPARPEDAPLVADSAPALVAVAGRTRLDLVALSPRELYAAWQIRPEDRATALEWLGPDASRATLALRLFDITDLLFHGTNAQGVRDVDLAFSERHRVVAFDVPGRSLTASLGLRSPRGYFQPLTFAGPTHLPRESPAHEPPTRRLIGLPRRP